MASARTNEKSNARNGQGAFNSYFRHPDGYEYCLIINHDWHHVVWQRDWRVKNATWTSHDVSGTVLGLNGVEDSHKGTSIGVSADGIIYVSGNTHDTMIRMIRSVNPHDITAWEEAPLIPKMAKFFTNLVENGVVENNTNGWSSILPTRYTADRVSHKYGWGSTTGNDTDCQAFRLTRTADTLNFVIGQGLITSISNSKGFPATEGNKYTFTLSMRCGSSIGIVRYNIWMIFRNETTEISRVVSTTVTATNSVLWYRPNITLVTAPAGTKYVRMEYRAVRDVGNAEVGDSVWTDGAMLTEGDITPGDIVYRDGGFIGGYQNTSWVWNGTPYASTSTGAIRANGYAGMPMLGYNRYLVFSDGTLVLSGSQPMYVDDPVGRAWSMWKMEAGETNFKPLVDGTDGCLMRNVMSYVKQGSTYPVLSEGNKIDGGDELADRVYAYHTYIHTDDSMHVVFWFRMWSNHSYGRMIYMRSYDKGQTWESVTGEPLTIPVRQNVYDDGHSAVIKIAGVERKGSTGCSIAIDKDGYPHFTVGEAGNVDVNAKAYYYYNGTVWVREDMTAKYGFSDNGVIKNIRGDMWIFGAKSIFSSGIGLAIWGANHTQDTGLVLPAGRVNIGTPDGVYQFESSAQYEGALPFSGGLDEAGNDIYRASIPDGEMPRVFSFGDGIRSREP